MLSGEGLLLDVEQDLVLAPVVVVEAGEAHLGRLGHVADGCAVEPLLREDPRRALADTGFAVGARHGAEL
jgi:hypothetical protein